MWFSLWICPRALRRADTIVFATLSMRFFVSGSYPDFFQILLQRGKMVLLSDRLYESDGQFIQFFMVLGETLIPLALVDKLSKCWEGEIKRFPVKFPVLPSPSQPMPFFSFPFINAGDFCLIAVRDTDENQKGIRRFWVTQIDVAKSFH